MLSKKQEVVLSEFYKYFNVKAHSLAEQYVYINHNGYAEYTDTEVYGDTFELVFYYQGDEVDAYRNVTDDTEVILAYATKWYDAGCPDPFIIKE